MTRLSIALPALVALLGAGCLGPPPPPRPFAVVVSARTDEDEPLPGVSIGLDGVNVGRTDQDGRLVLSRREPEGTHLQVLVQAPEGYQQVKESPPIVLRRIVRNVEGQQRELPIDHVLRFSPRERQYAVLVDVGEPNLPVEAFGARQAVTNAAGVASFVYRGSPGDELTVTVKADDLVPKEVVGSFVLGSHSEAYVVQGRFSKAPPAPRPVVRRPVHVRQKVHIPQALRPVFTGNGY